MAYRSQTTEIIQKKYEDRLIYFYLLTEEGLDDSSVKADAFAYMIFKIKDNTGVIAQQFQCVRNRSSYNRAPTAYSIYKCPAYRLMRVTRSE